MSHFATARGGHRIRPGKPAPVLVWARKGAPFERRRSHTYHETRIIGLELSVDRYRHVRLGCLAKYIANCRAQTRARRFDDTVGQLAGRIGQKRCRITVEVEHPLLTIDDADMALSDR